MSFIREKKKNGKRGSHLCAGAAKSFLWSSDAWCLARAPPSIFLSPDVVRGTKQSILHDHERRTARTVHLRDAWDDDIFIIPGKVSGQVLYLCVRECLQSSLFRVKAFRIERE